jgi:hypothetical protein
VVEIVLAEIVFREVGYISGLYMRDIGRCKGADVHDFLVGCSGFSRTG